MKVTVINNGQTHFDVFGRSVSAGESYVFLNQTKGQLSALQSRSNANLRIRAEFEPFDYDLVKLKTGAETDPAGGVKTKAITLSVRDQADANDVALALKFGVAAFSDAACTELATDVLLKTATTGSFISGANTYLATVVADSNGDFSFTVEIPAAAARHVYIGTFAIAESQRLIDSTDVKNITFSA